MCEPLSAVASVFTIAGSATESIKVLLTFFRQFRNAPAQIQQWLATLESLCSTLSSLQYSGQNLDLRYRPSSHFQQRLLSCVLQLRVCSRELSRFDAELEKISCDGKEKWDQKARRSWVRAKWAMIGDHKMRKAMKIMDLYHFEFVMELLKVLVTTERILPPAAKISVESRFGPSHQVTGLGDRLRLAPQRLLRSASNPSLPQSTVVVPVADHRRTFSTAMVEHSFPKIELSPTIPSLWSHQMVKPAVFLCWHIWGFRFMARAGPAISQRSDDTRKAQSGRYQQVGFGLFFSVYLPRGFRQRLGLTLCNFQVMMNRRLGNTLQWNLGFPTTVPSNAEIFKSARTNSTEDVRRLLSAGKASPQDTTIFGTTLLHSASRSGNLELVRLLIREGADVNAQDEDGESPLHGAMGRADNYDVARTLVENGADLLCKAVDGKTPFHNIFNNTISLMLVKDDWLENMPPDSEAMSMTHYLAWSSQSTLKIFQRGHSYDDVHLMSPDSCGRTCLHLAASRGNLEVLSYLVSQASSEDVEKKDVSGRTPLHYAAESSRAGEVIDTLMRKGCNIHAKDNAGQNGLHWAARRNNLKAAEKLITLDGWRDLLSNDMSGRTPSQEVSMRISPALYSLLRELETSDGRWTERSSSEETRPGCVSSSADDGFSPGLEIFGILAMIFIMLLGAPD